MTLGDFRKNFKEYFDSIPLNEDTLDNFFFSNSFDLSAFHLDRAVSLRDEKFDYIRPDEQKTFLVPIDKIVGNGWLFWDGPGKFGYPKESKLVFWYFNDYLPISATYIEDKDLYHVSDGNHRIYTAHLRGITHLPLQIEKRTRIHT